ncbi:hypothetical protein HK101_000816 [Irineochytrium annulatum]|nr:hypothetical protein HK101_000816 [Irineochytrium annulatum]
MLDSDALRCILSHLDTTTPVGRTALLACILSSSHLFSIAAPQLWSRPGLTLDLDGSVHRHPEHGRTFDPGAAFASVNVEPTSIKIAAGVLAGEAVDCRSTVGRWHMYLRCVRRIRIKHRQDLSDAASLVGRLGPLESVMIDGSDLKFVDEADLEAGLGWLLDLLKQTSAKPAVVPELHIHESWFLLSYFIDTRAIERLRIDGSRASMSEILSKCPNLQSLTIAPNAKALSDAELALIAKHPTMKTFRWDAEEATNVDACPSFLTALKCRARNGRNEALMKMMDIACANMRELDVTVNTITEPLTTRLVALQALRTLHFRVEFARANWDWLMAALPKLPLLENLGLYLIAHGLTGRRCDLTFDDRAFSRPLRLKSLRTSEIDVTLSTLWSTLAHLDVRHGTLTIDSSSPAFTRPGTLTLERLWLQCTWVKALDGTAYHEEFAKMIEDEGVMPWLCDVYLMAFWQRWVQGGRKDVRTLEVWRKGVEGRRLVLKFEAM